MFFRILRKSLSKRKGKIAIAVVAVIMGAAIVSALLTVSLDVTEKVNYEFRKFGANLLVVPESDTIDVGIGNVGFGAVTEQRYINESDLYKIKTISWQENVLGYAPFLYQVVNVEANEQDQRVVLVGTWFERITELQDGTPFKTGVKKINTWWEVQGSWIDSENDTESSMIGVTVAEKLGLGIGDHFTIKYRESYDVTNETTHNLKVVGIVTTGGSEDNQIFVNLQVAQYLTKRPDKVHTVQVSALCTACPVDTFAKEIEEKIPYVDARTVKQLTSMEMSVLGKIEDMMFLVTIVALLASALGVTTTMTTSVIERQREIGLMKSIGAENRRIASLFLTEAAIIGATGGMIGYLIGLILAQLIGMSVFNSLVSPRLIVFPIVMSISIAVALLASALPVRRAVKIVPVVVLRGE